MCARVKAFTIFCGLGINNCLLYDEKARAAAQQAVALEVIDDSHCWSAAVNGNIPIIMYTTYFIN